MSEKKSIKINIDLPENLADGIYSNLTVVNHSDNEFVIDFISIMPATPKARVKARIVLNPVNAKKLSNALSDNIRDFEDKNGEIGFGGSQNNGNDNISIKDITPLGEA